MGIKSFTNGNGLLHPKFSNATLWHLSGSKFSKPTIKHFIVKLNSRFNNGKIIGLILHN